MITVLSMKIIFVSIAFIHFVFCQITRLPHCNKYGATFKVSRQRIKGGIDINTGRIEKYEKIESKEICSSLCIENEACQSAFYGPEEKECELYDIKFYHDELEESNSKYYLTTRHNEDDSYVSMVEYLDIL